jgi:hypothetical protein
VLLIADFGILSAVTAFSWRGFKKAVTADKTFYAYSMTFKIIKGFKAVVTLVQCLACS